MVELSDVFLFILLFLPVFVAIYSTISMPTFKLSNILASLSVLYITSLLQKLMTMLTFEPTNKTVAWVGFVVVFLSMFPLLLLIGFTFNFAKDVAGKGGYFKQLEKQNESHDDTFEYVRVLCGLEILQALFVFTIFNVSKMDTPKNMAIKQFNIQQPKVAMFILIFILLAFCIIGETVCLIFQKINYDTLVDK